MTQLILDMVHHNPGEPLYDTAFDDPAMLQKMGHNGKVYFLFDSPLLAINWESVDASILPPDSADRRWVEAKAARIRAQHAACRAGGLAIFAMSDMVLFPRRLVELYQLHDTFGDPRHPQTRRLLRAQIGELFTQFPDLDGLVVRIGETYLHDAPYHLGSIHHKRDATRTIIPLLQLLREEICEKWERTLIFRTWYSFDQHPAVYEAMCAAVPPHPRLIIGVKHCEGDFHRANPFSRLIGMGHHRQIIEVQCAREYEGKGAYPNYIAHGIIDGFEEHGRLPPTRLRSIGQFARERPDLFAGIWTWSRGGGWNGPYIQHELWPELNAWVLAQWARDPARSETEVFHRFAQEQLGLAGNDIPRFRRLCLLSADAVLRGRNSTRRDMNPWWTRDQGISWPGAPLKKEARQRNLQQKDEAVRLWQEIVRLAEGITWPDAATGEHARGSAYYGLHLFEIYRTLVYLAAAEATENREQVQHWLRKYDEAWANYNALPEQFSNLATLYTQDYTLHLRNNAHEQVAHLQKTYNQ